ncbi:nuclear transport factor 2 family protein [Jiangella alba]|uniref:DUF4440 domain-containing protein n=1 Tax=Jiangella alba TaxID=561176 RepID=A0A1H5PYI3_9ACTN|nr:nuclear transport factor 2 family protein [Jiangella alba]SEF18795.1 protein of unknown function [Jiangella alba]
MSTPEQAVDAWWQAMQDRDADTLTALTLPDYIASGGPDGRSIGRDALLAEAAAFFTTAQVDDWTVSELVSRTHGPVAVCSYAWSEHGTVGGQPFALSGLATDVLVLDDGAWRHQAHHVSLVHRPGPDGAP